MYNEPDIPDLNPGGDNDDVSRMSILVLCIFGALGYYIVRFFILQ